MLQTFLLSPVHPAPQLATPKCPYALRTWHWWPTTGVLKVMGWNQTDLGLSLSTVFSELTLGKLLFYCDGMKVTSIN